MSYTLGLDIMEQNISNSSLTHLKSTNTLRQLRYTSRPGLHAVHISRQRLKQIYAEIKEALFLSQR